MSSSPDGYPANPLLRHRERYRHWTRDQVRWSDTDLIGHANNLAIGAYCETGRCMFMQRYFDGDPATRQLFLLTQLIVNFQGELHWPAQVEIGTGVMHLGRSSVRIGQGLFDGERCFASSEAVMVLIDPATRRPKAMPDEVRAWFDGHRLG